MDLSISDGGVRGCFVPRCVSGCQVGERRRQSPSVSGVVVSFFCSGTGASERARWRGWRLDLRAFTGDFGWSTQTTKHPDCNKIEFLLRYLLFWYQGCTIVPSNAILIPPWKSQWLQESSPPLFRQESDRSDGFFVIIRVCSQEAFVLIHAWVPPVVLWIAEHATGCCWSKFLGRLLDPSKSQQIRWKWWFWICAGWYLSVWGSGSQGRQAERSKEGGGPVKWWAREGGREWKGESHKCVKGGMELNWWVRE